MFFLQNQADKPAIITHSKGQMCNSCVYFGISIRNVVPTPTSDDLT